MSRILVVSAHAADFCSRSGGTLHKHAKAGDEVRVVVLTYGERSESGGLYTDGAKPPLDEVRHIRHEEATQAAEILGVEIDFWKWEDLSFDYSASNAKQLAEEIRRFRPDMLVTHHGPDPISVDHDTTWQLVMRGAQMAGAPGLESELAPASRPQTFLFEATVPLTEFEGFSPNMYVDVTDVWSVKVAALEAFQRAQGFLVPWYTDVAKRRAFQAGKLIRRPEMQYAEAFSRVYPWVGDYLSG
jgi:4-oxalomesaconate hydratase